MSSAGNIQLCAGQASGCEAAVHAIDDIFDEQSTDALLLVDADNASIGRSCFITSDINAHRWPFTSGIVIAHHLVYLFLEALKSYHLKEPHKVTLLQCLCML